MSKDSLITNRLWNSNIAGENYPDPKQFQEHILEQYKVYVASAQTISAQRSFANTFFLTLHTLLLGALGLLLQGTANFEPKWLVGIPVIGAIVLCWVWARLISSYSQLNNGKFAVIEEFEKKLPAAPFVSAEWTTLGKGQDPKLYRPFTSVEKIIPWIFAGLYIAGAIAYVSSPVIVRQSG